MRAETTRRPKRIAAQAPARIIESTTMSVGNGATSYCPEPEARRQPLERHVTDRGPGCDRRRMMPRAKATNGSRSPAVRTIATAPYGHPYVTRLVPSESRENIATVAQTVAITSSTAPMRSDRDASTACAGRRPLPRAAWVLALGGGTVSTCSAVKACPSRPARPDPRRGWASRRRGPSPPRRRPSRVGGIGLRRKVGELIAEFCGATFRSLGVGFTLGLRLEDLGDTLALVGDAALGHLLLEPRQLGQTQGRSDSSASAALRSSATRVSAAASSASISRRRAARACSSSAASRCRRSSSSSAAELGPRSRAHDGFANAVDDARRIAMEVGVASHADGLTIEQRLEVVGKRPRSGALCPRSDRDHRRSALERVGDLHSHEVPRHVDSRRPGGADHRQHGIDAGEMIGDHS